MRDDDVLPVSTPTSLSVVSLSFFSGIPRKDTSSDSSNIFCRGRYKFWAFAPILLLAFWSMLTGTVTLRWSAGDLKYRFNDDYNSHAAEDLDVLDVEEREKLENNPISNSVKHCIMQLDAVHDLYFLSQSLKCSYLYTEILPSPFYPNPIQYYIPLRPKHSLHNSHTHKPPAAQYQGNDQNTPFETHPKTMCVTVFSSVIYYSAYNIVQLQYFAPHRFGHQCLVCCGYASVASLASVLLPDSVGPFVYLFFVLLSASEWAHCLYRKLVMDEESGDFQTHGRCINKEQDLLFQMGRSQLFWATAADASEVNEETEWF